MHLPSHLEVMMTALLKDQTLNENNWKKTPIMAGRVHRERLKKSSRSFYGLSFKKVGKMIGFIVLFRRKEAIEIYNTCNKRWK